MRAPLAHARARAAALLVLTGAAACGGEAQQTDAQLQAAVDSLVPLLESLSGLEQRGPIHFARRSRAQLRAFVEEQLAEKLPPEELAGVEATYRAFGLLPDTLDLRALLLELYTEQVVGYYDPARDTLYLVDDVPAADLLDVLAHELVHALQDQHADLDALIDRSRGNDRQTAAQAAIEGHATLVMFALQAAALTGGPVDMAALPNLAAELRPALEGHNERFPVFRDAPRIVRETLLFPYLGGAGFVQELWRAAAPDRPAPLGEHLPLSTEQVLHPRARFLQERDEPTEIVLGAADG
ncbi:MAG TPA: DUF6782 family putative metallopeptidase, partial [Longimicrobiales bacterium]|nr:DUF6782 family putative metallopeptidase [Longimicrobiales bacterium]